jgi:hypothetical protein
MRTAIKLSIIIWMLIASVVWCCHARAACIFGVMGSTPVATCTTAGDTQLIDQAGSSTANKNLNTYCTALPFTVTANTQITEVSYYMRNYGAGNSTVRCSVFTDSGGAPSSEVADTSVDLVIAPAAWGWYTWTLTTSKLLTGTTYHAVCRLASGDTSMIHGHDNATANGQRTATNTSGTCGASWSAITGQSGLRLWGCAP